MPGDLVHLSFEDLAARIAAALSHYCSPQIAAIIAENMALAERDGATSHGIFRLPGYLASLRSGWVTGHAVPTLEGVAPAFLRADAQNTFTQVALATARDALIAKARANGVALLSIRNSHHFGALWPDVEPFARQGLVALSVVNSFACVVPHGGFKPVFGTNPIAFAAPRLNDDPLVFDQATSALANGDVQIAAREGRQLPPGSGIDKNGHPTTDPNAILDGGALLTFGGYKGSALSMMVELLSAALSGGNFSFEVDWSGHPGAVTPKSGQFLLLIDPSRGATHPFTNRVETLIGQMRDAGQERLPGERRYENRRRALRDGISLSHSEWNRLVAFGKLP